MAQHVKKELTTEEACQAAISAAACYGKYTPRVGDMINGIILDEEMVAAMTAPKAPRLRKAPRSRPR